ncbi:MAG: formyltransferase family protein [Caldilineaceae bacterium]
MEATALRIVTFNFLPLGYDLLTNWIHEQGHRHVLAVTTPGPTSRPTPSYIEIVKKAPRDVDVLVTTRLRSVATPLIRSLQPDLIACLSFPYRITPELCAIPTYGAVNIHPAVLPAYRGPNVMRQFYEGAPVYGATAHWIAEDYDTGNILSQQSAPMPELVTFETVFPRWRGLMMQAIAEGMARAIAGDPGTAQDNTQSTYAAPFSEEEKWLNWNEPSLILQRKATALNALRRGEARARIEGQVYQILETQVLTDRTGGGSPGACLERNEESLVVQTADGAIRVKAQPVEE